MTSRIKKPFECGLGPAFDFVGGRWKAGIIWELNQGELRFSEIKRKTVGVSEKMLIQQLKELESHGLVERIDYKEMPLRIGYKLTTDGHEINRLMTPIAFWGKKYAHKLGVTDNYSDLS